MNQIQNYLKDLEIADEKTRIDLLNRIYNILRSSTEEEKSRIKSIPFFVDSIVTLLKDEKGTVRGWAAAVLGELGDKDVVDFLIPYLKDPEKWVRLNTATALTKLDDLKAMEPMFYYILYGKDNYRPKPKYSTEITILFVTIAYIPISLIIVGIIGSLSEFQNEFTLLIPLVCFIPVLPIWIVLIFRFKKHEIEEYKKHPELLEALQSPGVMLHLQLMLGAKRTASTIKLIKKRMEKLKKKKKI